VIAGNVAGTKGAVTGIAANPTYLDMFIPPGRSFTQSVPQGHTAFAYVFEGKGAFVEDDEGSQKLIAQTNLVVWEDGDLVKIVAGEEAVRLLLISAQPLGEPIARYGPFASPISQ
jgi:redox-sensitive bicupin YhaK (pirin superfamily)